MPGNAEEGLAALQPDRAHSIVHGGLDRRLGIELDAAPIRKRDELMTADRRFEPFESRLARPSQRQTRQLQKEDREDGEQSCRERERFP